MDLLFISLIIFMLLIIAFGSVMWCVAVSRDARRAKNNSIIAEDMANRVSERLYILEARVSDLADKTPQNAPQEPTADDRTRARMERQFDKLQEFQLHDYGLNFGGIKTDAVGGIRVDED